MASGAAQAQDGGQPQLALMGTIPIYWGESDGFSDLLNGTAEPHWARAIIEEAAQPVPLDYLSEEALAPHRFLLMAQPRGLSGEENVALDAWVRAGGRLLLFADPWMTGESRYGIGDRRRPQDTILLSPILNHWGLDLTVEVHGTGSGHDHFEGALEYVEFQGQQVPLNEAGVFQLTGESGDCAIELSGLMARCGLDDGEVLLMADAALLDLAGPYPGAEDAFRTLLAEVFPEFGDETGNAAPIPTDSPGNDGIGAVLSAELPIQPIDDGQRRRNETQLNQ